jgi:hypothetical protein
MVGGRSVCRRAGFRGIVMGCRGPCCSTTPRRVKSALCRSYRRALDSNCTALHFPSIAPPPYRELFSTNSLTRSPSHAQNQRFHSGYSLRQWPPGLRRTAVETNDEGSALLRMVSTPNLADLGCRDRDYQSHDRVLDSSRPKISANRCQSLVLGLISECGKS